MTVDSKRLDNIVSDLAPFGTLFGSGAVQIDINGQMLKYIGAFVIRITRNRFKVTVGRCFEFKRRLIDIRMCRLIP